MRYKIINLSLVAMTSFSQPVVAGEASSECGPHANYLIERKAFSGDVQATLYLARKYLLNGCSEQQKQLGFNILREASDAGIPEAQLELAQFALAEVVTLDDEENALELVSSAAHSGLTDAQELFGVLLMKDAHSHTKRDEGMFWIGSAANQGSAKAAMIAFTIYKHGLHGFSKDECMALYWAEAAHRMSLQPVDFSGAYEQIC